MNTKETEMMSKVEFATTTRAVGGELISSSNQATHVGVVRSVSGNSPHIAERLSAMFGLPLDCLSSSLAWLAIGPLLHQATPAPVVFFLAGCLPLRDQLHLRIFSLSGQLCRFRGGDTILAGHASNICSSSVPCPKSWFWIKRNHCLQYGLPHPLYGCPGVLAGQVKNQG